MPSLILRQGVSVRLKHQSDSLPDFVVERCLHDRCWLRQPHWPDHIQIAVNVTELVVPEEERLELGVASPTAEILQALKTLQTAHWHRLSQP